MGGNRPRKALTRAVRKIACSIRASRFAAEISSTPGSFGQNQVRGGDGAVVVTRDRFPGESFPGGDGPISRDEQLGRLLAGAGPELHPGRVKVAIHRLGRDPQPRGDLFAAVAFDDVAQTVPLTVGEEIHLSPRPVSPFPHAPNLASRAALTKRLWRAGGSIAEFDGRRDSPAARHPFIDSPVV